jgi:hypothetical protein
VNIPGAVFATLTLTNVQPRDGGSYSVVVDNGTGAVLSDVAQVIVLSPLLPLADHFADRVITNAASGVGSGDNFTATREAGEPWPAGKFSGKSVWLAWRAPADGIALFDTRGSSFDTVLAVYTNAVLAELGVVAADDDRGGFLTSLVTFNAQAGVEYQIAIAGIASATGHLVLNWSLESTTDELPRILLPPVSGSVTRGGNFTFTVLAVGQPPLSYQWYHGCLPVPDATNDTLSVTNVQEAEVGRYTVQVSNPHRTVESVPVFLEIGPVANVVSRDKVADLLLVSSSPTNQLRRHQGAAPGGVSAIAVSVGTLGLQTLNNSGASGPTALNPCGAIGGRTKWLALDAQGSALLRVDTLGSAIDTVLTVYTWPDTEAPMNYIICDKNSGPGGKSLVRFPAAGGTIYYVAADGVNGAEGIIKMNWALGRGPTNCLLPTANFYLRPGASVTLPTVCDGNAAPAPSYQWLRNGLPVAGATNNGLTLANFQAAQAGRYEVVVSNALGLVTNAVAVVGEDVPVRFAIVHSVTNGQLQIRLRGSATQPFVVQAATNLNQALLNPAVWLPVYTNALPGAPMDWLDPNAILYRQRFYRAVR